MRAALALVAALLFPAGSATAGAADHVIPRPDSHPYDITVGPDGALWFTLSGADRTGRTDAPGAVPGVCAADDPHADEVINIFGSAIRQGPNALALKATMFAYPTAASDVGYIA